MPLRRIAADPAGAVNLIYALMLPALMAIGGGGVNMANFFRERTDIQSIADETAIAAARELNLSRSDSREVGAFATSLARERLDAADGYTVDAKVLPDRGGVRVEISGAVRPSIPVPFFGEGWSLAVTATARVTPGPPLCALALEETGDAALLLRDTARLTARECAVQSNSTAATGLAATEHSALTTLFTCSSGGMTGPRGNYTPHPVVDCPPIQDPLGARPAPSVPSGCTETDKVVPLGAAILKPGVYCGGLKIGPAAAVVLQPGTYVMKDGPLEVADLGSLVGTNVGFHLVGARSTFTFAPLSVVTLVAPKKGGLAGILFFEDRDAPLLRTHRISSNQAQVLLGTFYLPRGRLVVDSRLPIALKSAYTIVVARKIELLSTVDLVLNARYDETDVPVPAGVGSSNGKIHLSR